MNEYITSSVTAIDPSQIFDDGFELSDQNIIPSSNFTGSFTQGENLVEFYVYDASVNNVYSNYNFEGWTISNQNTDTQELGATDTIVLTPDEDILKAGFQNGTLYGIYNFINLELNSSADNRYFISQISSDRTEIALQSNFIESSETAVSFTSLKQRLDDADYFDEFYISFGDNEYVVGVNLDIVEDEDTLSILIKLYEPLPGEYQLKDEVYIATKVGETQAYRVEFIEDYSSLLDNANYIKGPNINIDLKDLVNNSTTLKSKSDLISTNSSQSLDKLTEVLNQKGVVITPNYSYNTFNEFVNFSSAKSRINNFVEKVASIQAYQADITTLTATTSSNPNVGEISSSIAGLETNIQNIIKNFDGFESYQYYESSSFAYPKTGSAYPYSLKPTTDTEVLEWLGSDVESSQYYGGYRLSASLYDEDNQNWLYYTIPEFIKENPDNDQYLEFSNMVGQHFDEIWLYTKALSERFDTTNDPNSGLPLGLAEEAVKNLGFPAFGNNYNNQDNFIGLTGEDNGSYVPPTGSELINQYIAINNGSVINYWNLEYSYENYVEQLEDTGFPYAIDKVSKEIFKRLYHNMAYLTKKKGTISGLRQLINIWGIPNTILRINEFGGKNKDNSDDYDLWYNRYSLAYTPVANQSMASSSIKIPWMPLERNNIADSEYIVPDGFAFRFKTEGIPSSSYAGDFYSQSLAVKKSNNAEDNKMDFGVMLYYTPKTSGSYSGSSNPDDEYYGELQFQLLGNTAEGEGTGSATISLPFFDKGWWSVLVQRDQHVSASDDSNNTTYTIYAKNKQYNGYDGNNIGWEGSASFTIDGSTSSSYNGNWNSFGVGKNDGIYLGGYISGSSVRSTFFPPQPFGKIFSGSFQEFRYYSNAISEEVFNDFVMNPESIEGNNITGSESSFDIVNFRAPLGNELEHIFTSSVSESFTERIGSYHPAKDPSVSSLVTESFVDPATGGLTSSLTFIGYENITTRTFSKPNREVYFLDQPSIGIRNRVSNKIQVEDGDQYGTVLSREISIDQNYQISRSYTEDITSLEVAFSPQDEINDDIIQTFGYGVVSDTLADPRHLSSSDSYYPRLRSVAEDYFKKYKKGNIYDYIRLIKYFDNSIFKAIKSYVPARTSVTTGVIIKQHMLERNRRPPVILDPTTKVAVNSSSSFSQNIEFGNLEITSSIPVGTFSGGPGGVVNDFNIPLEVPGQLFLAITTSILAGAGEIDVTDEGAVTNIESTSSGLFEFTGNGIDIDFTQENGFSTFPYENVPLIFALKYYRTNDPGDVTFKLKRDGTTIQEETISLSAGLGVNNYFFEPVYTSEGGKFSITIEDTGANMSNFEVAVYKSYEGIRLPGYYSLSTSPTAITDLPQNRFDYELNKYNLRQGYLNSISTTLGSQEIGEVQEKEFYNGEYSGSTLIATSQSLFDNPYILAPTTEISYDVDVGIRKYDRAFSSGTKTVTIFYTSSTEFTNVDADELNTVFSLGSNEVLKMWVAKDTSVSIDNLKIAAIAFNKDYYPFIDQDPGIYPSKSLGMDGGQGGSWAYFQGSYDVPNFYIRMPDPDVGTIGGVDSNAFNEPSNLIWSVGLKPTNDTSPSRGTTIDGNPWFRFDVKSSGGGSSRPILGNSPAWNTVGWGQFDGNAISVTNASYYQYLSLAKAHAQYETTLNTINSGECHVLLMPLTYIELGLAGSDVSSSVPAAVAFHHVDENSNFYQNTLEGPDFTYEFDLPVPTGAPEWVQNNVSSSTIRHTDYPSDQFTTGSVTIFKYKDNGTDEFGRQLSHLDSQDPTIIDISPVLPEGLSFGDSDFNPLLNNVSSSRPNSFIELIDYSNGIDVPNNIDEIISGSAVKANTPDSNYTQKSRIIPRYEGSKLESNDYNHFTPGDISYGASAVIDKNPIYFAHFKKSYHNLQLHNTFTFEIDSLIISPQEDITGTNPVPVTIKVDGGNDLLFPVNSTFEVDRRALIAYDNTNFTGLDGQAYDFSQLKVGTSTIFQGALEMQTIGANTSFLYGNNPDAVYPRSLETMSFTTASFINEVSSSDSNDVNTYPGQSNVYEPNIAGLSAFMVTGSNKFFLAGGYWEIDQPYYPQSSGNITYNSCSFNGPGLGLLHSLNVAVSMSETAGASGDIGIPNDIEVDPDQTSNYFTFNFSGSDLHGYVDNQLPFIIKKDDEIRVTYNVSNLAKNINPSFGTQDFIVTGVTGINGGEIVDELYNRYSGSWQLGPRPVNESTLYNVIEVYPDPSTFRMARGEVNSFTIRRRINADDRVIVYQTPPSGAYGIQQATQGGFLIPNDFSPQQKRNALTLINQLKEKNAFTRDDTTR